MKNFKTRKISIVVLLVAIFVFCTALFLPLKTNISEAYASEQSRITLARQHDEQIRSYYRVATIDENFEDDRVIVICNYQYSKVNGEVSLSDFNIPDIEFKSVEDMYRVQNSTSIDSERTNFRQILSLELKEKSKENVLKAIEGLEKLENVLLAQPSYIYDTTDNWIPTDEFYGQQWGLAGVNGIQAEEAWNITRGESQNITVGIMEGGIQSNHEDLSGHIVAGNFTPETGLNSAHGTHVAGIISGVMNDIGIAGISQVSVAVLSRDNLVESLTWAEQNGIKIINASYYYSQTIDNVKRPAPADPSHAQALENYDGIFIASAGNDGVNTDDSPHYPSGYGDSRNYPNVNKVVSVGSLTQNAQRSDFSNYGENSVHIYAPGSDILSTYPQVSCATNAIFSDGTRVCELGTSLQQQLGDLIPNNFPSWEAVVQDFEAYLTSMDILPSELRSTVHHSNGYHYMSGTSMAAPHVTGVAALLLSLDPTLTGSQLKTRLIASADTIDIDVGTVKKLNAYRAVEYTQLETDIFNTTILSDGTLRIDGLNTSYQGILKIPYRIDNKIVTQIKAEAFYGETGITEVIIPNTITNIGNAAFYNCTSLVNVAFEGNSQLNYISGYAFQQCLSLKSLTIPSTVTTISYGISSFGEKLTYYTDLSSDPNTWDNHWNKADWISIERPVVWGCTLSTDKSYVVSFTKTSTSITKSNAVNGISAPYRCGYTFGGWYSNSSFSGTAISAKDIATASNNVTYYAKWIPNHDVIFDTNAGDTNSHFATVQHGVALDKPTTQPIRDGYVFKYWALSTNLNQEYNWNTAVENNIILKAIWEEIGTNYVVTFDLDGGEWTNNTQKLVSSGSTVNRPSSPTKVGYTFSHWALSGQTTSHNFSTPVTSDITLVAIWMPTTTRTVTFDTDGGYGDFPTITVNQYGKIEEPEVEPVRAGYYFKYWALSTNLNQEYNWNASISQNITLVAVWESFNCIVTFDANGGTFGLYSLTLNVGDTVGEFLNGSSVGNPTRTGYTFKYWALSTNTSTAYNLNATITSTQTIRLVAVWNINTYTVTFDKAGGSGSTPNQTIAYGSTATKPFNPTRDGYTFKYWALSGGTTEYNFSTPVTANVSLVAIWEKEESCVAAGTLITLADGRQVPVETLTGNEMLLVWNLHTGSFDVAPILFIDHDEAEMYKIINLQFSDGTQVKVIYEHAFWDFNLNKYVFLREDAAQYVGHWFNKQTTDANGNMIWTRVQLINVTITEEYTTAWSPVTYGHLCIYVNGMLSMPGATEGLINIFEVAGDTMQIDQEQYLEDIAMYGLFTYEEFAEIYSIPETIFEAFGGEYLKVSIGKGLIDYEALGELIERYSEFFE